MDLVDTDVMIDLQRQHPPAIAWFRSLTAPLILPGLVAMELIQDARNKSELRGVLNLIAPLTIVWPDQIDCIRAMKDFTAYHLSHELGLVDSLIGACAIGLPARLLTFNVKHYCVMRGLTAFEPYIR